MMDIIIWVVLILLLLPCCFCGAIRAKCCKKEKSELDRKVELGRIGAGPGDVEDQNGDNGNAESSGGVPTLVKVVGKIVGAILGGYLITAIIIAIYLVAFKQSVFFAPALAETCVTTCDGTDPLCCNYEQLTVPFTDVTFESEGLQLNGWYMESNASAPTPHVPILYNHGSGRNIAVQYRIARYQFLLTLGVQLFTYDYPGYGKSQGTPSEDNLYASSQAALAWLNNKTSNAPATVILGRSLGGAVAVNLATSANTTSNGLILQSTFSKFGAVGTASAVGLPVTAWVFSAVIGDAFDSAKKIPAYDQCLYQSHSKADEWVPLSSARKLYDDATKVPASCKKWVEVMDVKHDDPLTQTEKDALTAFVNARRGS